MSSPENEFWRPNPWKKIFRHYDKTIIHDEISSVQPFVDVDDGADVIDINDNDTDEGANTAEEENVDVDKGADIDTWADPNNGIDNDSPQEDERYTSADDNDQSHQSEDDDDQSHQTEETIENNKPNDKEEEWKHPHPVESDNESISEKISDDDDEIEEPPPPPNRSGQTVKAAAQFDESLHLTLFTIEEMNRNKLRN